MQTNLQTKRKKVASTPKSRGDAVAVVDALMENGDIKLASTMLPVAVLETAEAPRHDRTMLVPLSRLITSTRNVRRVNAGSVEELAALIESQGLLHPLIVIEEWDDNVATGRMEVVAGARRLAALQLLSQRGRISADERIECKQIDAWRAAEVSLAENSARVAMHPADQFAAFKRLCDEGQSAEDIALRFGVSPLTVNRRLRLATLAPSLIEKFRANDLTLEQMMALSVSADHAAQEAVWQNAAAGLWMQHPSNLRRALTDHQIHAADSPLVRLVGLDAYLAAGGHVRRDLFSGREDDGFIDDTVLLHRLVADELNAAVDKFKGAGWKWVEVRETFGWLERRSYGSLDDEAVPREPTESEAEIITALETEIKTARQAGEAAEAADDRPAQQFARQRYAYATEQLELLRDQLVDCPDHVKAASGVVLTVADCGIIKVVFALVRPDDAANASDANSSTENDEDALDDADASGQDSASGQPFTGSAGVDVAGAIATSRQLPEISEKLTLKLSSHRTAALQNLFANNHRVALATVAHALVLGTVSRRAVCGPLELRVTNARHAMANHADDIKTSRAWSELDAKLESFSEKIGAIEGSVFAWLLTQSIDDLVGIVALCAAVAINAVTGTASSQPATELATALDLDMADWWQPTANSFFGNLSKDKIIDVVAQTCGVEQTLHMGKLTKHYLIKEAEQKMHDKRWLPAPLR